MSIFTLHNHYLLNNQYARFMYFFFLPTHLNFIFFEIILIKYQPLHIFIDEIFLQPMLCVTAVNPFLLSRVPALLHVMNVRKKIGIMLPYVRCPFRRSINRGLGNRRYLLESNDFFALKDLLDLSKGVFAGQLLFLAHSSFVFQMEVIFI